jgi:pSer/pThr/pTyr-binding forkhead associated (FHA) protein
MSSGGQDDLTDALLEALGLDSGPSSPQPQQPTPGRRQQTLATPAVNPARSTAHSTLMPGAASDEDLDVVWDFDDDEAAAPARGRGADAGAVTCFACETINPLTNRFCGQCGVLLEDAKRIQAAPAIDESDPRLRQPVDVDVRLVSINEDGTDGLEIPLRTVETILGRRGDTRFPTDAFLSPSHAKIIIDPTQIYIEDLHSLNGTYVRIRSEVQLSHGDCFLMGRQVLRFEQIEQNISPKARARDGTRYMGSPPPSSPYKILQIGLGGIYQNVYCLPERGSILGREKGDITFQPDRFMSGRHARIYMGEDGLFYLGDLNSSNGTWVRILTRHPLEDGDLIFLGQQLFRIDAPSYAV